MAVGRSTRDEINLILAMDSAVKSGYSEYVEHGFNEDCLTFVEGEKPTRFRVRRLNYAARNRLKDLRYDDQKLNPAQVQLAFRCGLVQVSGYLHYHDGREVQVALATEDTTADADLGPMLNQRGLEKLDASTVVEYAIAVRVYQLSEGDIPFLKQYVPPSGDGGSAEKSDSKEATDDA